jgi:SOS-response transcriptional repressor LexA
MNEPINTGGVIKRLPTKQQNKILIFIKEFIDQNGYSPTYREIKTALNYSSVSIVAKHIDSLIQRGQLVKRSRTARSLELTNSVSEFRIRSNQFNIKDEKWLIEKVNDIFSQIEEKKLIDNQDLNNMKVSIDFLRLLKLDQPIINFIGRYHDLVKKVSR